MKLCIGMPIQDTIPGECYGHHLATVCEGVKLVKEVITINPVGLSPHDYARYTIAEEALAAGCTHLFFMDDDTVTPSGGLTELIKVMEDKKAVAVSGYYLRRGYPYTPVWSVERDGVWFNVDADQGIHEIHVSGLGCCLLDLQWMVTNLPKPWFRMDQNDNCTIITDDVALFRAIRKAGGLILGDANVQCGHIGRREYIVRGTADSLRTTSLKIQDLKLATLAKPPEAPTLKGDLAQSVSVA